MKLNEAKGNMYRFITHTGNAIKGECLHNCSYCYMKRWGKQNPVHLDEKELSTPLSEGNFIFIGSSCDMFADNIPDAWIIKTLEYLKKYDNKYLFQSKNPNNMFKHINHFPLKSVICTTIETNRFYFEYMGNSPTPIQRAMAMGNFISDTYVTCEPLIDFDLKQMVDLIKSCHPLQVNIGSDSGCNNLPEPLKEKVLELIKELQRFTIVNEKINLSRILNKTI